MDKPWRHPRFLALYEHLPHPLLDAVAGWLMRRERPRWLVRAVIAAWIRRGRIAMHDFEAGPFATAEAFFLRRLRPGARPLADGIVAPVDGTVTSVDPGPGAQLTVKGVSLSLADLCGDVDVADAARTVIVVFLSPDGYHHVHAPAAGRITAITPIAGRTFPQNDDALAARPDVYLRNARVVVQADRWTLVFVAASLVSHIVIDVAVGDDVAKGERLGCFTFGSTVVLLLPDAGTPRVDVGHAIHVGQSIA